MTKHTPKLTPLLNKKSPTDVPPRQPTLSRSHLKTLRRCRMLLIKDLDPADVLDSLADSGIDDVTECRDVISVLSAREEKVGLLLDRIETSDERTFKTFLEGLRHNPRYQQVHSVLDETLRAAREEGDDQSDDDVFKERAAMAGDTIRRILKGTTCSRQRRCRASCSDDQGENYSTDEQNERRYLDCYVVATRGRLNREPWIKHSNNSPVKSEASSPSENCEKNSMCRLKRDVIFKCTKRENLQTSVAKLVPENCSKIYIVEKDSKFSNAQDELQAKGNSSTYGDSIYNQKHKKNLPSRKKSTNSTADAECGSVPPPLPPKPNNLPLALSSYPSHVTRQKDREISTRLQMLPPQHLKQWDSESQSPVIPTRLTRVPLPVKSSASTAIIRSVSESRNIQPSVMASSYVTSPSSNTSILPGSLTSTSSVNSPNSAISPGSVTSNTELNIYDRKCEVVNEVVNEEDDDDVSLNFTINCEESSEVLCASDDETTDNSSRICSPEAPCVQGRLNHVVEQQEFNDIEENKEKSADDESCKQAAGDEISRDELADKIVTEEFDSPVLPDGGLNDKQNKDNLLNTDDTEKQLSGSNSEKTLRDTTENDQNSVQELVVSTNDQPADGSNSTNNSTDGERNNSTDCEQKSQNGKSSDESSNALNARDSGVDSVASQACLDSPCEAESEDKDSFLAVSLGNLEIHAEQNGDRSSSDYSYYEDIELVDGFLSAGVYLDPQSGQSQYSSKYGKTESKYDRRVPYSCIGNYELSPEQKILYKGSLVIVNNSETAVQLSETVTDDKTAVSEEIMTVGYDKDGELLVIPTDLLKHHDDPRDENWFYPVEMSSRDATLFLASENQPGCFIVYRSTNLPEHVLYNLSLCSHDRQIVHYRIVKNILGDVMIEGHDHSFLTVADLVDYFRRNQSRLVTRLRRSLREVRLPLTAGHHYPAQFEIPRSCVRLNGKIIERGRFGVLCQGVYRGLNVTVKVLQKDAGLSDEDDFIEEALTMMNIKHDNIVRIMGVCCRQKPFYIITEFFDKGTVKKCLESETIPTDNIDVLFDICIQMVSALLYLESLHFVIHRAVCASNFVLTGDMLVKLTNFERARSVVDDNYQASPNEDILVRWAAPEVLTDLSYSTKSDVWSLGVVFWEVFSRGTEPFNQMTDEQAAVYIAEGGRLEKPPGCSHDLYSMMKCCWRASIDERPTFSFLSDKIKGKSSIYYVSPIRNSTTTTVNRATSMHVTSITTLPLPAKSKTTNHLRSVSSSALSASRLSTPAIARRGEGSLRTERPGGVTKRTASLTVTPHERLVTSSSDSSSIISSVLVTDADKDDLTRGDKIRKSLRKLMRKKTPSVLGQSLAEKHSAH